MKTTLFPLLAMLAQMPFLAVGADKPADQFVAHEWGTFTSVQGADGVQFEWNPFTVAELPGFVYDRSRPNMPGGNPLLGSPFAKNSLRTLQRMETPVIYFYSDQERTVDVKVKFPQGVVTEWYPNASAYGPYRGVGEPPNPLLKESVIRWDQLKIMAPQARTELAAQMPKDKSGSHYYAARETDSALLKVSRPGSAKSGEVEKFLFYRGVGMFTAPLQTSLPGSDEQFVKVQNQAVDGIKNLFILRIRGGEAKWMPVHNLKSKEDRTVRFDGDKDLRPLSEVAAEVSREMERALTAEGLYPKEAAAMVATWRNSWFAEQGLRVLYTLPRAWTDETLPLEIKPAPPKVERVFVGRAEVITPSMEFAMLKQVVRYSDAGANARPRVVAQTRELGFGRFAEPTMHRVMNANNSREFSTVAVQLLQDAFGRPKYDPANIPLEATPRTTAANKFE